MAINHLLQQSVTASRQLITLSDEARNSILTDTANELLKQQAEVLAANEKDLARMDPANPKYDRLKLTADRLEGIAGDMKNVATLPSPLGKVLSELTRPNGMVIRKVSVPFGVIGVIYEARPNVTFDVFSLLFQKWKRLRVERWFRCGRFQPGIGRDYPPSAGTSWR